MSQVQMKMYIYNIRHCHFVNWTPHLIQFHLSHIAREIITRNIEQKVQLETTEKEIDLYFHCQKPYNENEQMIGCYNVNCPYKWLYYSCSNIKRPPK